MKKDKPVAFKSKNKKSAVVSVSSSTVVNPPPAPSQPTPDKKPCQTSGKADLDKTSSYIAQQLQESAKSARFQIRRIIRMLGEQAALGYLKRAQEVEKSGGMLTIDGTAKRSVGGIFFRLVKIDHPDIFQLDWKAIRARKKARKLAEQQKQQP